MLFHHVSDNMKHVTSVTDVLSLLFLLADDLKHVHGKSLHSLLQAVFLCFTPHFLFFLLYFKPTELARQGLRSALLQYKLQRVPADLMMTTAAGASATKLTAFVHL